MSVVLFCARWITGWIRSLVWNLFPGLSPDMGATSVFSAEAGKKPVLLVSTVKWMLMRKVCLFKTPFHNSIAKGLVKRKIAKQHSFPICSFTLLVSASDCKIVRPHCLIIPCRNLLDNNVLVIYLFDPTLSKIDLAHRTFFISDVILWWVDSQARDHRKFQSETAVATLVLWSTKSVRRFQ